MMPKLPPRSCLHIQPPDHYWYGEVYGYTGKQMQAYARKVVEEHLDTTRQLRDALHQYYLGEVANNVTGDPKTKELLERTKDL